VRNSVAAASVPSLVFPTDKVETPREGAIRREGKGEKREREKKDLIRFPLEFTWLENKKGAG